MPPGLPPAVGPLVCLATLFGLLLYLLFLGTLERAVARCRPPLRDLSPAQVWLALVPCIHLVWTPLLVGRLASTLQAEYRYRGLGGGDFGRTLGMAWFAGGAVQFAVNALAYAAGPPSPQLYLILSVAGLPQFGLFVAYWRRVGVLSRPLAAPPPAGPSPVEG